MPRSTLTPARVRVQLADDPRLFGDWELIGCTSNELRDRQGLTGLGVAPFTEPRAVFYRLTPTGEVLAKEVLEFFGQPIVVNEARALPPRRSPTAHEPDLLSCPTLGPLPPLPRHPTQLRGRFGFVDDGEYMQEEYTTADLSGVANSDQFTSAKSTTRTVRLTEDGALRLSYTDSGFMVLKKLNDGALDEWLMEKRLPLVGGTIASMDQETMKKAYPYLGFGEQAGPAGRIGGNDAGGNPFGGWNPFEKKD
jgi:hypothetical protein